VSEEERVYKEEMAKVRPIVVLQAAVRTTRIRKLIKHWHNSATTVRAAVRGYLARLLIAELEEQMRRGGKAVKHMDLGGVYLADRYLRLQVSGVVCAWEGCLFVCACRGSMCVQMIGCWVWGMCGED
jgi:hypothetical protein